MQLSHLLESLDGGDAWWLRGILTYEQAYIDYRIEPTSPRAEEVFYSSAEFERRQGRTVGEAISLAQAAYMTLRRARAYGLDVRAAVDALTRNQDVLAAISGPLARSWSDVSIPAQLATPSSSWDKMRRPSTSLRRLLKPARAPRYGTGASPSFAPAPWRRGSRLLRTRGGSTTRIGWPKGRAGVLVSLADAYCIAGHHDEAQATYAEALRQPQHMDNAAAIAVARRRLDASSAIDLIRTAIYLP